MGLGIVAYCNLSPVFVVYWTKIIHLVKIESRNSCLLDKNYPFSEF